MASTVKELNIIMSGVGGQGVVLMSELIGTAAVRAGLRVRGSEVLGMAQRGGSVYSNIRLGSEVESPITAEGRCDILVALEPSEGLRQIGYINESSSVVLNVRKIVPTTVSLGRCTYPNITEIKNHLLAVTPNVTTVDAVDLAEKAGNRQATNVVMLGALFGIGKMPISVELIKEVIKEKVPAKAVDANMKAFDLGYQACVKA